MCQPLFTQTRLIGGHAACWQVWLTIDRSTYQAGLACARATQLQPSHATCCHTAVVVVVGVNDFLRNAGSKPSAFLDDVVRNVTVKRPSLRAGFRTKLLYLSLFYIRRSKGKPGSELGTASTHHPPTLPSSCIQIHPCSRIQLVVHQLKPELSAGGSSSSNINPKHNKIGKIFWGCSDWSAPRTAVNH